MSFNVFHFKKLTKFTITSLGGNNTGKRWYGKYFLTTPIFYVNAEPHIGHLYTALIGDAATRYQKLKNPNISTKYMVGTDEHGLKVAQSAENNKINVKEFCDKISHRYKELFKLFNIEYDDFVRTTEDRHTKAATALWTKINSNGHIYKDEYSGWYCVADEMFVPETFLNPEVGEDGVRYTLEGNKPVHFLEEINYKFKLSNFQKDLLHWLEKEDVIKPKLFYSTVYNWIEKGDILKDISVSRPSKRVSWGIPVPGDESQNIYVWLDALSSYLCSNGYPNKNFKWPPDVQIIGMDILKFHAVFWPAFLIAADLEPPNCILCHSHWLKDGEKMSKSKGNVVNPFEQSNTFTSDGFRFFLLREGVPHRNGNYIDAVVCNILNSELADSLGNLLSRCTGRVLNPNQIFPVYSEKNHFECCGKEGDNLMNALKELPEIVETHFEEFNFYKGIDAVIAILHLTNKFFQEQQPWVHNKKKEGEGHVNAVLHLTMESLRVCGILLQPIVPNISCSLLDKLSIDPKKRNLKDIVPYSWDVIEPKPASLLPENVIIFNKLKKVQ